MRVRYATTCLITALTLSVLAASSPPAAAGAPSVQQPAAPTPVLGRSADVSTVSGSVSVQLPGTHTFVPLTSVSRVPLGTIVDATNGTVQLTSAADTRGHTQTGQFYGGAFRLAQRRARGQGGHGVEVTALRLTGGTLMECPAAAARTASAKRRRRSKLWGKTKTGDFTSETTDVTAGRNGDPTWLTEETCSGTLVKVTQGAVSVENLHTHKTVVVTAGHSLFTASHASSPPSSSSSELMSALGGVLECAVQTLPPQIVCESQTGAIPAQPAPASEGLPGGVPGLSLMPTGRPLLSRWASLRPYPVPVTPLAAGSTWIASVRTSARPARLGITCSVGETSVRCSNESGDGFTITATSYSAF